MRAWSEKKGAVAGKRKEIRPSSPQFPPVLFSFADPIISEPVLRCMIDYPYNASDKRIKIQALNTIV